METLKDENFRVVNLVTIAANHSDDLYTDYCHLTSAGNLLVARRLHAEIAESLEDPPARPPAPGSSRRTSSP